MPKSVGADTVASSRMTGVATTASNRRGSGSGSRYSGSIDAASASSGSTYHHEYEEIGDSSVSTATRLPQPLPSHASYQSSIGLSTAPPSVIYQPPSHVPSRPPIQPAAPKVNGNAKQPRRGGRQHAKKPTASKQVKSAPKSCRKSKPNHYTGTRRPSVASLMQGNQTYQGGSISRAPVPILHNNPNYVDSERKPSLFQQKVKPPLAKKNNATSAKNDPKNVQQTQAHKERPKHIRPNAPPSTPSHNKAGGSTISLATYATIGPQHSPGIPEDPPPPYSPPAAPHASTRRPSQSPSGYAPKTSLWSPPAVYQRRRRLMMLSCCVLVSLVVFIAIGIGVLLAAGVNQDNEYETDEFNSSGENTAIVDPNPDFDQSNPGNPLPLPGDIICDGNILHIQCQTNERIRIISAMYGQLHRSPCLDGGQIHVVPDSAATCISPSSMDIVRGTCEGKRQCWVSAEDRSFGKRCDGLSYLHIEHVCEGHELEPLPDRPIQRPPGSFICEGAILHIGCPPNQQIHIMNAVFGRQQPYTVCGGYVDSGSFEFDVDCVSPRSIPVVRDFCEGLQECHVPADGALFGNAGCGSILKYLSVEYVCEVREDLEPPDTSIHHPPGSFVCEHDVLHLICPPQEQIHILAATFGREHPYNVCGGYVDAFDIDCISIWSLEIVQNRCEGLQDCHIEAEIELFGNPCGSLPKYLAVEYICEVHDDCPLEFCTEEYDPQCGSDGVTYGNPCELARAVGCSDWTLTLVHPGECADCSMEACTLDWNPQCGSDGITYGNPCALASAACHDTTLTLAHAGECRESSPPSYEDCQPIYSVFDAPSPELEVENFLMAIDVDNMVVVFKRVDMGVCHIKPMDWDEAFLPSQWQLFDMDVDLLIGYFINVTANYHQDYRSLDSEEIETEVGHCALQLCHDVPSFWLIPNEPTQPGHETGWSLWSLWWYSWWPEGSQDEGAPHHDTGGDGDRRNGDGRSGDGDGRSGTGDGTTGDHGDGRSGDGDRTTGDGDGTATGGQQGGDPGQHDGASRYPQPPHGR